MGLSSVEGSSPVLDLESVTGILGGEKVVNSVSLSVESGAWLSIIGPNGSGKSTLINIILGLIQQDSGEIFAMKVLKKDHVVKRKQIEHTMTERRILENIRHPFIVSLRYAFQTSQKLYMVFDYFNGGDKSLGHKINPHTRKPYKKQIVSKSLSF
mgnify:CR=1 FL=1